MRKIKSLLLSSILLLGLVMIIPTNVTQASPGNPTDGFYVDNKLVKSYAELGKMQKREVKIFLKSSLRSTKPTYVVVAGSVYKFVDVALYTPGKPLPSQTVADYELKNGKLNDTVESTEFEVIGIE